MAEWWSIEILDGETSPAAGWRDQFGQALAEAAVTNGATDWTWHVDTWGVVLQVRFADDERWEAFRALPAVRAALDAVPDPVNGLLIYRGRGGGAGAGKPRKPRPVPSAAAASRPESAVEPFTDLAASSEPALLAAG